MRIPELLAPAGDFVSLQAAIDAGADAVYFGLGDFNMRARSGVNFKLEDLPEIARRCGRIKRYLALNAIVFDGEFDALERTIAAAKDYIDAAIASDWGVISLLRKHGIEVHASTQMSISNSAAVEFLAAAGVARVVLARECTLAEIARIIRQIEALHISAPGAGRDMEVECFVHGAQCVAESGRCFMSHSVFGKSACRGECTQPCRRRYLIKAVDFYANEDGSPVHDAKAEFILGPHTVMSARDVCALGFIDRLMEAGIASFKIEGRARNANYVKTVVECYRCAIDAVAARRYTPQLAAELTEKAKRVFHREFSDGMYFGRPGVDQFTDSEDSLATTVKRHVGIVIDYFAKAGIAQVQIQDHAIRSGDRLQIHGHTTGVKEFVLGEMRRDEERVEVGERGNWVTFKSPRCRVGDKVFFEEHRG